MRNSVGLDDVCSAVFDPSRPFRGSSALAAGHVSRGALYGPRFHRILPDVYVAAEVEVDLLLRARAAHELVAPDGILAGWCAAEFWGASCAPRDAPVEVITLPGRHWRSRPGLRVHRDALGVGDIVRSGGMALTTPLRTACDLGRWAPSLVEAVVALDSLVDRGAVDLAAIVARADAHPGARGVAQWREAAALARTGAQSPMETRARLALVHGGLPEPELQYRVTIEGRTFYLDLAYPELRIAVEYDGIEHRSQQRARRDLLREALLTRAGWTILRFDAGTVLGHPRTVAARVAEHLRRAEMAVSPLGA